MSAGKGRFQSRQLNPLDAVDARHLLLPLVQAERAWSYAMQLQSDIQHADEKGDQDGRGGSVSRMRFHAVRRLKKAVAWAKELAELTVARADPRTALEAEVRLARFLLFLFLLRVVGKM